MHIRAPIRVLCIMNTSPEPEKNNLPVLSPAFRKLHQRFCSPTPSVLWSASAVQKSSRGTSKKREPIKTQRPADKQILTRCAKWKKWRSRPMSGLCSLSPKVWFLPELGMSSTIEKLFFCYVLAKNTPEELLFHVTKTLFPPRDYLRRSPRHFWTGGQEKGGTNELSSTARIDWEKRQEEAETPARKLRSGFR